MSTEFTEFTERRRGGRGGRAGRRGLRGDDDADEDSNTNSHLNTSASSSAGTRSSKRTSTSTNAGDRSNQMLTHTRNPDSTTTIATRRGRVGPRNPFSAPERGGRGGSRAPVDLGEPVDFDSGSDTTDDDQAADTTADADADTSLPIPPEEQSNLARARNNNADNILPSPPSSPVPTPPAVPPRVGGGEAKPDDIMLFVESTEDIIVFVDGKTGMKRLVNTNPKCQYKIQVKSGQSMQLSISKINSKMLNLFEFYAKFHNVPTNHVARKERMKKKTRNLWEQKRFL